jgi:hypothetical protein
MSTYTDTFNRDDIRRVHASFAADYKIVAEWTQLHSATWIERNIAGVKALAEEQYLDCVHLQLKSSSGEIRRAAVYKVTTNASVFSTDRPGDLYWEKQSGDVLRVIVDFSQKWWDLTPTARQAFEAAHMAGWGTSDFDGSYAGLVGATDKHFVSRAYGMDRTQYSK